MSVEAASPALEETAPAPLAGPRGQEHILP
jgi:hypothetical protein